MEDATKELEDRAIGVEAKEVSDELPVEGFNTNNDEIRVSLGKPGKDVTKELEEGAIGLEAKEERDELPVEGANANDNETWVFLGKPAESMSSH